MSAKTKKIIKVSVDVILWLFLIFALLMTVLAFSAQSSSAGFPKLGDKCFLTVQSDSMAEPGGFYPGDMIVGKVVSDDEKQNLEVGDVITFYMDLTPSDGIDNKELNSHRIYQVGVNSAGQRIYYTRGDHNKIDGVLIPDTKPVVWNEVEAVWTGSRYAGVGNVIDFVQSKDGFLYCVVLPLLVFFLYEVYLLISTILKLKNQGKRQITAADEEMIKQRAIEEYLRQQAAANAAPAPAETPAEAPAEAENKE